MNQVHVLPDAESLAGAAAQFLLRQLRGRRQKDAPFWLALSGGSTPAGMFEKLGEMAEVNWTTLQVFWVDERCVPPNDPASNYRLAWELWLGRVGLRSEQMHRIPGELGPDAAELYEEELRRSFGLGMEELPRFDLIFLGMGEDGHTASLFPGSAALEERKRLVVAAEAPVQPKCRITFTLRVLNEARVVAFLVSGEKKAPVVASVLRGEQPELPAARVRPRSGELHWFLDRRAYRAMLR